MARDVKIDVKLNLAEFVKVTDAAASRVIRAFTMRTVERMKAAFKLPKSGRVYRVSRTGRPHQASAPGEAPAILTGFLQNSILTTFPTAREGVIAIGAAYAPYLEYGTRRGNKIKPRPYIAPAIKETIAEFKKPGIIGGLIS